MAESSGEWKKPSDVMKLRKYKNLKKSVAGNAVLACNTISLVSESKTLALSSALDVSYNLPLKRKNPFSHEISNSSKVQAFEDLKFSSGVPNLSSSRLFTCVDNLEKKGTQETSISSYVAKLDEREPVAEFSKIEEICSVSKSGTVLPDDWSLRSKLRLFVPSSTIKKFWPIRGTDEAQGIADYVTKMKNEDMKQVLQSHLMYWSYPNIPWLKTFPRMDLGKHKIELNDIQMLNKSTEEFLLNEWLDAMTSCYQNIKQCLTSYMYVCCQHMTILFISSSASGKGEVVALVTPTTRGLRKSLDNEGIDYELPLLTKKVGKTKGTRGQFTHSSEDMKEDEIEIVHTTEITEKMPCEDEEDEDDEEWLEKLGLDKKRYQGKEYGTNNQTDYKGDFKHVDYRPTSVIMMTGMNSNAFFNFFVNSGHVISTIGPLAGIPPTILSPFAFKNSSLRSLMIHNKGELVGNHENMDEKRVLLEITGPVLPCNFKNICQFFASNCDIYNGVFTVLESSVPFNCLQSDSQDDKEDNGLICKEEIFKLRNSALRSIEVSESLFRWK